MIFREHRVLTVFKEILEIKELKDYLDNLLVRVFREVKDYWGK
jgi:hypothetical protein